MTDDATTGGRENVTVLGLGPMGQALAGAFLDGGHPTTVWNRTAAKADVLVDRGAATTRTPAEAVARSRLVVICVLDDAAVRSILDPAVGALRGRMLVNLTADSPTRAREMAAWAEHNGIDYLDGAILTPAPTMGGPDAVVLYSGRRAVFEAQLPTLSVLSDPAVYLGDDPGRAAAHEVALLDLFWTSMTALVHAFALASAEGVTAGELAPFAKGIATLLPPIIDDTAANLDRGEHTADVSNVRSAAAGIEHVIDAADVHGIDTSVLRAARSIVRGAVEDGHGDDDLSRLGDLLAPVPAR
jgi:3-hydroxyisobutyrate dehydrogenase-like beta-hydroxyacid dehydrogenase